MPARMTETAWAQGAKNALICGVGVLFVWLVIAVVLWWVFDRSVFDSFWLAFFAIWCLIFPIFLGTWFYGRKSGGSVLLDCGPHPTRVLFLVNALLFPFVGLTICLTDTGLAAKTIRRLVAAAAASAPKSTAVSMV
jgi:hypothetical protein